PGCRRRPADRRATVLAHAKSALDAYRGDLLPGCYDDWALRSRAELNQQCLELCDLACTAGPAAGDLSTALGAARRRIQLEPLEEVGYRTLMQLQSELGDRAGAINTYHRCASVLERELGVQPDEPTR